MFIKPNPPGVNKPLECDRMHIVKVVSGDAWKVDAKLINPSNGMPANYRNTIVKFVLSENKFNHFPIWVGEWSKGVFEDGVIPGLVHVVVPDKVVNTLRRGTYAFSLAVTDIDGRHRQTQLSGYFEVEYEPSSPVHDIPYRDDETASSAVCKCIQGMTDEQKERLSAVLADIEAGHSSFGNVEEGVKLIAEYLVGAKTGCGAHKEAEDGSSSETEATDVEKALAGMASSIEQLVTAVKDALNKKPGPCPLPMPPPPPEKPFILRPPWYSYPKKPE